MTEQEASTNSKQPHWLTLGEAAQFLGVHPSTVRRWTDSGDLRCIRTPGGHRRFLEGDLHQFVSSHKKSDVVAASNALAATMIRRTRREMANEDVAQRRWWIAFDESERAVRRESGRRLLGLAIRYTSRTTGRDAVLDEGRTIAWDYGQDAAQRSMSLADVAQALLFFREMLIRAARPSSSSSHDAEDAHIRRSLQEYLDAVFCAAMDAYEQTLRDLIGSESSS